MKNSEYTQEEIRTLVEMGYEFTEYFPKLIRREFLNGGTSRDIAFNLISLEAYCRCLTPEEQIENNIDQVLDLFGSVVEMAIIGNSDPFFGRIYDGVVTTDEYWDRNLKDLKDSF